MKIPLVRLHDATVKHIAPCYPDSSADCPIDEGWKRLVRGTFWQDA